MACEAGGISGRVLQVSDGGAIREDWDMSSKLKVSLTALPLQLLRGATTKLSRAQQSRALATKATVTI